MTGSRAQAVKILKDRAERGIRLDHLFQADDFNLLPLRDQRLSKEIVQGVFRNLSLLDYFIAQLSSRPSGKVDSIVRWILRAAIYQIEFTRVPDHASVNESVLLCRRFKKSSAQSFVNGVLRAFIRSRPALPQGVSPEALAIRYSHPEWLVERYLARYGPERTRQILKRNNEIPESFVWVNQFKTSLQGFLDQLAKEGIPYEVPGDPPNAVRIRTGGFAEHRLYQEGYCFFMDFSSQRVAHLCDLNDSQLVGDLCAAPGGKTFLMASRAETGARIICSDIDFFRLTQIRTRALRYGVQGLFFLQMDLMQPAACASRFQSLLLDVPCSGTGTLRSNPDARWGIQESDLTRFHNRQVVMLKNGFAALLPGRDLVYSTCSTEPEENEDVVEEFLSSEKRALLIGDYFRTFPGEGPGDGFFAARVRRV